MCLPGRYTVGSEGDAPVQGMHDAIGGRAGVDGVQGRESESNAEEHRARLAGDGEDGVRQLVLLRLVQPHGGAVAQSVEAGCDGGLPGITGFRSGDEFGGGGGLAVGERCHDGDLPAVEHPRADALVFSDVCEGVVPQAGCGEGSGAVGEQNSPEPRSDLLPGGSGTDEVGGDDYVGETEGGAAGDGLE